MLATLRILRATTFLRLYKVFFIIIIRCADCVRKLECQRKHCPSTADKNPPLSQKACCSPHSLHFVLRLLPLFCDLYGTMIISSLKQTSPGRVTVCFEDGSEIKTTLNVITDMRLYNGLDADEELIRHIRLSSQMALTREKALELLSLRQMSCKEMRDKLISKGYDESASESAVQWLSDNRLLNDESYAAAIVRHYAAKGYGEGRIKSELSRRGIAKYLWDEALENMPETESKIDKFIASRLKDPDDREQIKKISNALFRRGYSWDEIRAALSRVEVQTEE